MQWYEEDKSKQKNKKINNILIAAIIITFIMMVIIICLIIYLSNGPKEMVAIIDNAENKDIINIIELQKDEAGNIDIYVPIKEVASYLKYKAYNGEYNGASEETDKCYIISENEVANYSLDSNIISKLNLKDNNSEYEYYTIEDKVFEKDGKLYTTVEGIENGFNVSFQYDAKSNKITIYTLDYLSEIYAKALEEGKYPGYTKLDTGNFRNQKAILQNMLVVTSDTGKYGVINARNR